MKTDQSSANNQQHYVECALHVWQDIQRAMKAHDRATYLSIKKPLYVHRHKRLTERIMLIVTPNEALSIDRLADYLDLTLRVWSETPKLEVIEAKQDAIRDEFGYAVVEYAVAA